TDTNNWGVKFFFPCMDKFTKIHSFKQVLIYLVELCNKHSGFAEMRASVILRNIFVYLTIKLLMNITVKSPALRKAANR
ncbi:hypothetical protein LIT56_11910, partial [Flavobacterium psychrophilum]